MPDPEYDRLSSVHDVLLPSDLGFLRVLAAVDRAVLLVNAYTRTID